MREIKTIPTVPECKDDIYQPEIYRLNDFAQREAFDHILFSTPNLQVYDQLEGQLRELIKSMNPSRKIPSNEYPQLITDHLQGIDPYNYGVWVYYPWSARMVHLLDEEEFVEVRTNRNRYKITREEQALLASKKLGVVGLSVGQSIALTIAIERTCGELRLADFDTVELSNLNRMRVGTYNLGLKKTIIAAREISEIDPYIKVRVFSDGLTKNNIDDFFLGHGKLDMLVEVCDGLDVKIISRFKARELGIPVVMDTNDRGMLDVERFDLEPSRPILHGLAGDLDPSKIGDLTNEEKIPYILTMIGAETISTRLKASMLEVEQSINTWPQLASSVTLGGAITTDVCRNIFLDQFSVSGRFYVDMEEILGKFQQVKKKNQPLLTPPPQLTVEKIESIADQYFNESGPTASDIIDDQLLTEILHAASLAPSGGNAQPWKFLWKKNVLFIFHDAHFSYSLLDYNNSGSYIAFGAMLENIEIKAASLAVTNIVHTSPLVQHPELIAAVHFYQGNNDDVIIGLSPYIDQRITNRVVSERKPLKAEDADALLAAGATIPGANIQFFDKDEEIAEFAEICCNTERIRFLHPQGHFDTFVNELRFTQAEVSEKADGLDVNTLNMKPSEIAALSIAKDAEAISFLHDMRQGTGFKKISAKNILTASAMGVLTMPDETAQDFLQGGRALQRIWLEATKRNIAFQPISQIIFMLELLTKQGSELLNGYELEELKQIKHRFRALTAQEPGHPVFVFRLCYSPLPAVRSLRKPLERMLIVR